MNCAKCAGKLRVVSTQPEIGGLGVLRWRKCAECRRTVATYEGPRKPKSVADRAFLLKYNKLSAFERKLILQLVEQLERSK